MDNPNEQRRNPDADYKLPSNYKRIGHEIWRKDNRVYIQWVNGSWKWETYRPDPPKTGLSATLDAAISAATHALHARFDSILIRGEMYDELADEAKRRGMDVVELIHTLAGEFAYKALERSSARSDAT